MGALVLAQPDLALLYFNGHASLAWHFHLLHELCLQLAIQGTPPPASSFWSHPIEFFLGWKNVIVMHERDKAIRAFEHRMEHQNDVVKRRYYMKMHGIETKDPITMIFGKSEKEQTDEEIEAEALGTAVPKAEDAKPPERRKFWGIF
uniref:Uncharacterized protein n=1 Tax=Bionectria ochroleuca TaxID=29856 RepID=A0A8H7NL66_BIOOC